MHGYLFVLVSHILYNRLECTEGSNETWQETNGIYIDDTGNYLTVIDNTVANCYNGNGLVLHNSDHIIAKNNTFYNNYSQIIYGHDNIFPTHSINNCEIKKNIFFSKLSTQMIATVSTLTDDISNFGKIDSNYYCRPVYEDATINYNITTIPDDYGNIDFPAWQNLYSYDFNSHKSPFSIPSFIINDTISSNTIANSTFDSNINGWTGYGISGTDKTTYDNTNKLDGGSLKIVYTEPYTANIVGSMVEYTAVGPVITGKTYLLKFTSLGDLPGQSFAVFLSKNESDFATISSNQSVTIHSQLGIRKCLAFYSYYINNKRSYNLLP